jgi:hypothetical protein
MPDGEGASWKVEIGRHFALPSSADQDLAHRLVGKLSEPNAGLALHEKDVFGIALRQLEEDLESGDAGVLHRIQLEAFLRGDTGSGGQPENS